MSRAVVDVVDRKSLKFSKSLEEEDNVYYNIGIENTSTTSALKSMIFSENRTVPILDKPSDYELAVVRFYIPASTVPIFIYNPYFTGTVTATNGSADITGLGTLFTTDAKAGDSIFIEDSGGVTREYVILSVGSNLALTLTANYTGANEGGLKIFKYSNSLKVRMEFDGSVITKPLPKLDYCLNCYPANSIYYYTEMRDMMNKAMVSAFTDLKAAKPAAPPTEAPFLEFMPESELFVLHSETLYDLAGVPTIKLSFDSNLYNRFFPSYLPFEVNGIGSGVDVWTVINIQDEKINSETIGGKAYFKTIQDYNTLALWNDFQSITLETDSIPVEPEFQPGQKNKTRQILTDFEPAVSIQNRQAFQFYPQGPLRWYDMKSDYPLSRIDLRVQWVSRTNETYPLFLLPGQKMTAKLQFRKKKEKILQELSTLSEIT